MVPAGASFFLRRLRLCVVPRVPTRSGLPVYSLLLTGLALGSACRARPVISATPAAGGDTVATSREATPGRRTVGVTPFRVSATDRATTALGFALADLLATDLARSGRIQLVERARLGEVLRELDLAKSGRVDSASAPRVGRLLAADELLIGALDTMPRGEIRLGVRVANVATGVVTQAIDARAPIAEILSAEKTLAFRLFDELGVILSPAERAQVDANRAGSIDALVTYGQGVAAELSGDLRTAFEAFRNAGRADPAFRAAAERATAVQARLTVASGTAALLPGIRGVEAPVISVVDRLNRPIDHITTQMRPHGGVSDPAFPGTVVTVVITVRRP